MTKPKEVWIQDDGGPQFDFIVSSVPTPRGTLYIEKNAYDILKLQCEKLASALEGFSGVDGYEEVNRVLEEYRNWKSCCGQKPCIHTVAPELFEKDGK